ncbi:hypothetical protein AAMO2058_000736200 [Amorphochlora amoebiformis]
MGDHMIAIKTVAMVLLAAALIPLCHVMWTHRKGFSFLRMTMLVCYLAAIVMTFGVILFQILEIYLPTYHLTLVFNLTGQTIAVTGFIECWQFLYNYRRLVSSSSGNKFIKIWVGSMITLLVIFAPHAAEVAPLLSYRCFSLFVISVEISIYVVMYRTLPCKNKAYSIARAYYKATIACRICIVLGVLLRMTGCTKLVILLLHYTSVLIILLTLCAHSAWGQRFLHFLTCSEVPKRRSKTTSTSNPKSGKSTKTKLRQFASTTPTAQTPPGSTTNIPRDRFSKVSLQVKAEKKARSAAAFSSYSGGSPYRVTEAFSPRSPDLLSSAIVCDDFGSTRSVEV